MSTWNDRLNEAMNRKGITASDLGRITGISPAGIKKWVDGVTLKPKYDDVIAACKTLDIAPEWLMDGIQSPSIMYKDNESCAIIEAVDVKGSCGYGVTNFEDCPTVKRMQVSRTWFAYHFPHLKDGNIKIITACGDSMSPLIHDNDAVFIDVSDQYLREGVYVLLVDGELFIKRVQRMPSKVIRLKSENPAYDPMDIYPDSGTEIRIIGRVVKIMQVSPI